MPPFFLIRLATIADAPVLGSHRACMFRDMGIVPGPLFDRYRATCESRMREMLETGEYIGWLALPNDRNPKIIAGAGVQLRRVLPHPVEDPDGDITIAEGRHAMIHNVFTESEWRRRGIARLLLEQIIAWARAERIDSLVLHTSDEGRALYEELGFIQTSEMRFSGRLVP
jgi:GNAT superfamily N-acetyltransferase